MDPIKTSVPLERLPKFDGVVAVEMPPDWRSSEPTSYSFIYTTDELTAMETRHYFKTMARSNVANPRLFTPLTLALASLFHPMLWFGVDANRREIGVPTRLDATRLVVEPAAEVPGGRYFLQSLLFLTGVTLSAAIVQDRWSRGTIESKLSRLWQAGTAAKTLGLQSLQSMELQTLVRKLASQIDSPGYSMLLTLKEVLSSALCSVVDDIAVPTVTLSAPNLTEAMRDRFGFVDTLRELLGPNLQAIIAYGSSVTSDSYADYDLLLVVNRSTAALERLAGKQPTYRGIELNIGVYEYSDFWTYQLASGDNLSDHALCLFGEIEVPHKPIPDLLARNYSFGFIRLRQLLGMAAFASSNTLHTEDDDKTNLYGYFVKIPLNVAKGTRGATGHSITKTDIHHWISHKLNYDLESMVSWCQTGRAGDAIATSAWCTQRVLGLLNTEHPAYEVVPGSASVI